jgi:quercetin dioxygenase-like cupin family protein/alkylhydroperoxidase/carboxymuconolactone decarboxylase family protein YurZ
MKLITVFFTPFIFVTLLSNSIKAQQTAVAGLDIKQQSIVTISVFTAKGDLIQLKAALNDGLNTGLTVNETKEVLIQLYAYTGFPRSLNALNTLMTVLKERKASGINDPEGAAAVPLPSGKTKLQFGTEMQTKLVGQPVKGPVYEFAPTIDQFLKEHLFADIFGRNNLDWKTRELVTIAALAALGNVEAQLRSHFNVGIYNGLTEPQLIQLVSIVHTKIGATEGTAANEVLQIVLGKKLNKPEAAPKTDTIFSTGQKITNNNFTGTAYLHQMVMPDSTNKVQVGNVTFAPGARSNWHLHPGGQILLAIDGVGYYQEMGQPKKILRKGDVVKCPPNIPHWHGASHDQPFIQIAITNNQNGTTVWLQPVTDTEYNNN